MDGVVHPNVEQAIGRDRIRKALKRYENRPADEHRYGIVRSVNEDGSYEVLLDGDVQTSRCAQYGTALVGDRVLAVTKKDGRNDLIGRLGGETVAPTITERFEGIEADIDLLKTNKVLWSGAHFMQADQTAVLSEAISEQTTGALLVFSYYSGGATNWCWHTAFIPKYMASAHNGQGWSFSVLDYDGYHMAKYIYVHDTKIVGNDVNIGTATAGGVQLAKSNWVLRYVIGV